MILFILFQWQKKELGMISSFKGDDDEELTVKIPGR